MSHHYIGVENNNLSAALFDDLLAVIKTWVKENSTQPALLYHKRVRDDDKMVLAEAYFVGLSVDSFIQTLADAFGLDPEDIEVAASWETYAITPSRVWAFKRVVDSAPRFTTTLYGGPGASWVISHIEVLAYLLLHLEDWQGILP